MTSPNPRVSNQTVQPFVFFGIFAILLLAGFYSSWRSMASIWWNDETFSHGLLILPISIWIIWRDRERLRTVKLQPSWAGLLVLFAGAFGWLLGELGDVNMVRHLGVVTMLVGLFPLIFGLKITHLFSFPIVFLFFMVPAGEFLVPYLMRYTADATISALQLSGIPVFRENMHFSLPTGRWSVVEACSGLRYIIAALVLACMFAYLNYRSWVKKLLFVIACLGLAVIANWIRAYLVVMVGHFSNMKYGTGSDHIYYGWFFFGLVMFAIFWFGTKWRDEIVTRSTLTNEKAANQSKALNPSSFVILLTGCFVLLGSQWLPEMLINTKPRTDFGNQLARNIPELKPLIEMEVEPVFIAPVDKIKGSLTNNVEVFAAYYAKQNDDSEMITIKNSFVASDSSKWNVMETRGQGRGSVPGSVGATEILLKSSLGKNRLAWTWYCVGGHCVREQSFAKGLTAFSVLSGSGDHSIAFMLSVPTNPNDLDAARALLVEKYTQLVGFASEFTRGNY